MKNTITTTLLMILGLLLIACEQKEKSTQEHTGEVVTENNVDNTSFSEEYPNAKKMKEIDAHLDPSNRVESLYWEKQTESGSAFTQVVAYLNADDQPMKITEYFVEGNFKPQGQRHFYLENNKLIAFYEESNNWIDSNLTNYTETRTIYNEEEPVVTQKRTAETYNEIEKAEWKNISQEHHSLKKVNKILSGTDEFQLHFISVIKADQLFLLLGEAKPQTEERYTTAVRVDEMTPFIEDLLAHLDEYKFRPVDIQFKVVGGNNSPEFRVLTNIAWKDEEQ